MAVDMEQDLALALAAPPAAPSPARRSRSMSPPVKDDDLRRGLADAISRYDATVGVGKGVTLAIRATSAPTHWRGIGEAATMVRSAPVSQRGARDP